MKARKLCFILFVFVSNWLQESACVKVVAAVSMWDVCMERGHKDLEQFEKVHRYISDQLFTNFVSYCLQPAFHGWASFLGFSLTSSSWESQCHIGMLCASAVLAVL